jgi:hypothetical protein
LVEPKDVVVAILGSSAALGGFVLVFLGVVIASYQGYAGGVPDDVVRPFRISGTVLLLTFAVSLVTVAISLLWLLTGGGTALYEVSVVLFALQLVALFAGAAWTTRMVLFR